jgi:pyruvyl transferase EpsO
MGARGRSFDEVARGLQGELEATLAPQLAGERECALFDFPNSPNVGDNLIWLGTRRVLAEHGIRCVYSSEMRRFSEPALRRRLAKGGLIVLTGGGNFGDLWPVSRKFREWVLGHLRDYRILQLPQSICFEELEPLEHMRGLLHAHPDFRLMVRDLPSLEIAERELGVPATLCPDMAFALGPLPGRPTPSRDVSFVIRTDKESALGEPPPELAAECTDWLDRTPGLVRSVYNEVVRWVRRHPRHAGLAMQILPSLQDTRARRRLRRGSELLGRGEVAVTDRLHGHILCVLLGIPHVCLDNENGKVRAFHERWTGDMEQVVFADSWQDALRCAASLRDGACQ